MRRTAGSPAGSWPGSRPWTATGTRRSGWPTPATSRRRRSRPRWSRPPRCWSSPPAASRWPSGRARWVAGPARGEPVAERARALRRFWELEGGVAINSVVAEMVDAANGDDPAKVIAVYQDAVAVLSRIWHEWFSARIRLAAIAIGSVADALPRIPAAEHAAFLVEVDRLHGE